MKITVQVYIGFLQGTVMQRFVGKSLVESSFKCPKSAEHNEFFRRVRRKCELMANFVQRQMNGMY